DLGGDQFQVGAKAGGLADALGQLGDGRNAFVVVGAVASLDHVDNLIDKTVKADERAVFFAEALFEGAGGLLKQRFHVCGQRASSLLCLGIQSCVKLSDGEQKPVGRGDVPRVPAVLHKPDDPPLADQKLRR